MIYRQLTQAQAPAAAARLNIAALFNGVAQQRDFDAATANPVQLNPGAALSAETPYLGEKKHTLLTQANESTCVGVLLTCAALIITEVSGDEVYAYHASGGYVEDNSHLPQIANAVYTHVVYVIPQEQKLNTYSEQVTSLVNMGFNAAHICVVARPNRDISFVVVNGNGDICFL
jgi:hypothetical protein